MAIAALLSVLLSAAQPSATEREVVVAGGEAPLHGSLLSPVGEGQAAAVLLIAGSGPTDRDGDSAVSGVKPGTLRLLAAGLAERGVMSLRFDKRGVGASRGARRPERDLRFDTFVDDAAAWARFLAEQPGVRCVVIVGHSEGSLIGMLVAQRVPVCGFVSIAGAGRPAAVVLREQLAASLTTPETAPLLKTLNAAIDDLVAGRPASNVPPEGMALLRPSIQPYLMSWFAHDPAEALKRVKAPVLILQGDRDLQVSVADAQALAAARPDAKLIVVPGMNHVLKDAPASRAGNIATYADPSLPLTPEVVARIADFSKVGCGRRFPALGLRGRNSRS